VMKNMRLFVAVDLPPRIKGIIGERLPEMVRRYPGIRWVKSENLHLTLKFLGEVEPGLAERIPKALEKECMQARPFSLHLGRCGAFPSEGRGRVIWLGLEGEVEKVSHLAERIDSCLAGLGFERETRPFLPHVTLGRMKNPVPCRELVEEWRRILEVAGDTGFLASEVVLFRSILFREGPTYQPLFVFELGSGEK